MKINLLEPTVYNIIAAGEVVENPASVVKELVENSIDAGATQIEVYAVQGGIKSLEVADNGCGIAKEELHKAILPHATSKIKAAADLDSIATLGFRGEALASIAAVSEIEIKSKYFKADCAAQLTARGGEYKGIVDIAYNQGTSILISNLFYNTPARFKFLKGAKTEESYVTKAMSQLIISNPDIAFKYYTDGKPVFNSDGGGLAGAISAIYDSSISSNLLAVIADTPYKSIKISGYTSNPDLYKNNRTYQTIIINGRIVAELNISSAVSNAYGDRLMSRSFPVFVINVVMPFDEVDVNVHPNKREVRFAKPREVYGAIYYAIKATLEAYDAAKASKFNIGPNINSQSKDILDALQKQEDGCLAALDTDGKDCGNKTTAKPASQPYFATAETLDTHNQNSLLHQIPSYGDSVTAKPQQAGKNYIAPQKHNDIFSVAYYLQKQGEASGSIKVAENRTFAALNDILLQNGTIGESLPPSKTDTPAPQAAAKAAINNAAKKPSDNYKVIGQIFDTYIAIEYKNEFILIDQHAAHERLLYDKLKISIKNNELLSQPLMLPYIYEDSASRIAELLELTAEISKLGFEIEQFGNNTVKINAVPQLLTDIDPSVFLAEVLEGIRFKEFSQIDMIEETLMQKACKSAIKGGYSFNKEQIGIIIDYFFASGMPIQCPHGRPTYISFSQTEIEKLFRRKL